MLREGKLKTVLADGFDISDGQQIGSRSYSFEVGGEVEEEDAEKKTSLPHHNCARTG